METSLLERKWFIWIVGVAGTLLVIFLAFAILFKARETVESYRHATFPQKTLIVNSDGKTKAMPDVAYLSFTIVGSGKDNNSAQENASKQLKDFTDYLVSQGVDKEDINVTQSYTTPAPVGFGEQQAGMAQTNQTINVEVKGQDKLADRVTAIMDAAQKRNLASGGTGGCLTFEDPDKHLQPARQEALAKAAAKAQKLADISGFKLGKLVSISDSYQQYSYNPTYGGACSVIPVAHMEVTPQELTLNISATYEIK